MGRAGEKGRRVEGRSVEKGLSVYKVERQIRTMHRRKQRTSDIGSRKPTTLSLVHVYSIYGSMDDASVSISALPTPAAAPSNPPKFHALKNIK